MAARPGEMGRRITAGREAARLGRREAARHLGVSARHLRAWERGGSSIPRAVRADMAALYGLPLTDLVPNRAGAVSGGEGTITVGSVSLSVQGATDDALRQFLAAVRSERNLAADAELPIRGSDAVVLGGILGDTPDAIAARIQELLGVGEAEAQDLGAWIWRRRLVTGAVAAGAMAGALTFGAVSGDPQSPPGGARPAVQSAAGPGGTTPVLAIAQTSPVREAAAPRADQSAEVHEGPGQDHQATERADRHDAHLAKIVSLQARMAEQDAILAAQAAQLAVQNVHIESQEAQIASQRGQLADNELTIADLTQQNSSQTAKLTEQSAVIKGLNGELVNQGAIIAEFNTQLADLATAIEALKEELAAVKSDAAVAQAQAASSIAAQANLIDSLNKEAVTATMQVKVAMTELKKTARQLAEAEQDAEEAHRRAAREVADLEDDVERLKSEIERLQAQLAALQVHDAEHHREDGDGKGPEGKGPEGKGPEGQGSGGQGSGGQGPSRQGPGRPEVTDPRYGLGPESRSDPGRTR